MHAVPVAWYLTLSAVLFALGAAGFIFRRSIITVFMSIELMLNAVNLSFVTFSYQLRDASGHIDEAKKAKEEGKEKVILFCWSGHGLMDLTGYDAYFRGQLVDYALPEDEMCRSLEAIKDLPKPPAR